MDTADYPLTDAKRGPQETAWKAQLATLPGADVISPNFGYPSDNFLWEHVNFDRVFDIVPMAHRRHDRQGQGNGHCEGQDRSVSDRVRGLHAPPLPGVRFAPGLRRDRATEALSTVSADDARRFLQYGGFPTVAPVKGTPEFRVAVEEIKARWASCDITNPQDPYGVLTEVVVKLMAQQARVKLQELIRSNGYISGQAACRGVGLRWSDAPAASKESGVDEFPLPELISPEELAATQALGEDVRRILASTGLPTFYQPNFREPPEVAAGVHIGIDPTAAGQVTVQWENSAELVRASIDESQTGDFTGPAVRLQATAGIALGEAIAKIVQAAGFDAGLGVDMDPSAVWVKPVA